MYTNAHPGQSCFNGAGPGRWWAPRVLGRQAGRTGASCWHRRFNYFTLSRVQCPSPQTTLGGRGHVTRQTTAALRRAVLSYSMRGLTEPSLHTVGTHHLCFTLAAK